MAELRAPDFKPVVLATGGTGGHVFPAEALAGELEARGMPFTLVTDSRGRQWQGALAHAWYSVPQFVRTHVSHALVPPSELEPLPEEVGARPLHVDQAHPAHADRLHARVVAEAGDVDPGPLGRGDDHLPGLRLDLAPVQDDGHRRPLIGHGGRLHP